MAQMVKTHVLVTCVRKHNNGKTRQCRSKTLPGHPVNWTSRDSGVAHEEMVDNKNDQIRDRNQSDKRGVLQAVESAQE